MPNQQAKEREHQNNELKNIRSKQIYFDISNKFSNVYVHICT